jgi:hypothetical protein
MPLRSKARKPQRLQMFWPCGQVGDSNDVMTVTTSLESATSHQMTQRQRTASPLSAHMHQRIPGIDLGSILISIKHIYEFITVQYPSTPIPLHRTNQQLSRDVSSKRRTTIERRVFFLWSIPSRSVSRRAQCFSAIYQHRRATKLRDAA